MTDIGFKDVRKQNRIYYFKQGEFRVDGVVRIAAPRTTHRLETDAGRKFMVHPDWMAIELEVDEWTL